MFEPMIFAMPPRVIPRRFMPQIDDSSLPSLLRFLSEKGVTLAVTWVEPSKLHFVQRVGKLHAMPSDTLKRPCLVSAENIILDGNHRAAMHRKLKTPCPVIRLGVPFVEAVALLFSFPSTYDLEERKDS